MTPVLFELPEHHWECPSCGRQHITRDQRAHTPMHPCPKHGIEMPYAKVHGRAQQLARGQVVHRVIGRGDYLAGDNGQPVADGRVVMAVHTEHADGHDTHVFAPVARVEGFVV